MTILGPDPILIGPESASLGGSDSALLQGWVLGGKEDMTKGTRITQYSGII